jgi:hypothetical protein
MSQSFRLVEPDWLTAEVKQRFAEAVCALLAIGGTMSRTSTSFTANFLADDATSASLEQTQEIVMAVLFPDGEHNILAWIGEAERREIDA